MIPGHHITLTRPTSSRPDGIYIDSVLGSDSNDGSYELPVQTFARACAIRGAKYRLFLKKGCVFREQMELPDGIYLSSYGEGARPLVTGAEDLPNASFTKTSGRTYTYQISLPSITPTYNPYALIWVEGVLMTWENNVRMGPRFDTCATSIAEVDATAGSQWWDSSAKILYIHPADNSDPRTNGKHYEASVRTLCIHGGDNVYVERIDAEKAYASSTSGQQGYQFLGFRGGRFYKCKGSYSWNHVIGVANEESTSNELIFENCLAYDVEEIASLPATMFVAFKQGFLSPTVVRFKNCVAKQPTRHATVQTTGFLSHGTAVACYFESCSVENCYYGIIADADAYTSSSTTLSGTHTFKHNWVDIKMSVAGNTGAIKSTLSDVIVDIRVNGVVVGTTWAVDSGYIQAYGCTDTPVVQNSYFGANTQSGAAIFGAISYGGFAITSRGNVFYNIKYPLQGDLLSCDYNTFYNPDRIVQQADDWFPPGYFTDLSAWQAASSQDYHSAVVTSAPSMPTGFWGIDIPDVLA